MSSAAKGGHSLYRDVESKASAVKPSPAPLLYSWASAEDIIHHYGLDTSFWALAPYQEAFFALPLNDWLHLRYCSVYDVHRWIHSTLVRILLFNTFCGTKQLPQKDEIFAAVDLTNRLSRKLPDGVLNVLEKFIVSLGTTMFLLDYKTPLDVKHCTPEDRSMSVIFVDADRITGGLPSNPREFLYDPLHWAPLAKDVLALPLFAIPRAKHPLAKHLVPIPRLDRHVCVCGECVGIQEQWAVSLGNFRKGYLETTNRALLRGCTAIAGAWEPMLSAVEEWLESLLSRMESSSTLFPWTSERRPGPYLLEIAEWLGVKPGTSLTVDKLLMFAVAMSSYDAEIPPGTGFLRPGSFLGYMPKRIGAPADTGAVLIVRGGWMYELSNLPDDGDRSGIMFLHSSDELSIHNRSHYVDPRPWEVIWMPTLKHDAPDRLPHVHDEHTSRRMPQEGVIFPYAEVIHTSIIVSAEKEDGFPGLHESIVRRLATLIRISIWGRIIETAYRPLLTTGTKCDHRLKHRRMTHCAPTAAEIISHLEVPDKDLLDQDRFPDVGCRQLRRYQTLLEKLGRWGHYLEKNRVCIVRCGTADGPAEPILALAGSFGKKVYIIHHQECWDCALGRMRERRCTIGIALNTRDVTACERCLREREHFNLNSMIRMSA